MRETAARIAAPSSGPPQVAGALDGSSPARCRRRPGAGRRWCCLGPRFERDPHALEMPRWLREGHDPVVLAQARSVFAKQQLAAAIADSDRRTADLACELDCFARELDEVRREVEGVRRGAGSHAGSAERAR